MSLWHNLALTFVAGVIVGYVWRDPIARWLGL